MSERMSDKEFEKFGEYANSPARDHVAYKPLRVIYAEAKRAREGEGMMIPDDRTYDTFDLTCEVCASDIECRLDLDQKGRIRLLIIPCKCCLDEARTEGKEAADAGNTINKEDDHG